MRTQKNPAQSEAANDIHRIIILEKLVAGVGFEPTTFGLWARRAARLLHPASSARILAIHLYECKWKKTEYT